MKVRVVVVPVTIQPVRTGDNLRSTRVDLVALQESDQPWDQPWATGTLESGNATDTARELLRTLNPMGDQVAWEDSVIPEPVMFDDRADPLTLVFTAAVPMIWADRDVAAAMRRAQDARAADDWARRWSPLLWNLGREFGNKQPYAQPIVEHWRQRLEEQIAALLFLPRFFTMSQLRDVYQGVWGPRIIRHDGDGSVSGSKPIDISNFSRWAERAFLAKGSEPPLLDTYTGKERRSQIRDCAEQAIRESFPNAPLGRFIAGALLADDATVVNPSALTEAAETFPTAASVRSVAGVGYREPSSGKPPSWYSSRLPRSRKGFGSTGLAVVYEPRPNYLASA